MLLLPPQATRQPFGNFGKTCKNQPEYQRKAVYFLFSSHGQNKDCGNSAIFYLGMRWKDEAPHNMVKIVYLPEVCLFLTSSMFDLAVLAS